MEIILTEYCHRQSVSYKQGMKYLLAPFFMIEMKDRSDILCFESFIGKYLISTFNDEEFGSLQCIFRMFRLLIQYHNEMHDHNLLVCPSQSGSKHGKHFSSSLIPLHQ